MVNISKLPKENADPKTDAYPKSRRPTLVDVRDLDLGGGEKKADVAKHLGVFRHVGLLINGPPGRHQTGRVALYLVIRLTSTTAACAKRSKDSLHLSAGVIVASGIVKARNAGFAVGRAPAVILFNEEQSC